MSFRRRVGYDLGVLVSGGMMEQSPNESILLLFQYVEKAMLLNLKACLCGHNPFGVKEGFAGSAPLTILEEVLAKEDCRRISARRLCGRWLSIYQKTKDLSQTFWRANDADYFICIEDDDAFLERVDALVTGLRMAVASHGRTVHVEEPRCHPYADTKGTTIIVDVRVSGIDPALSFVQAPSHIDLENVVGGFDFDIVQVMFDPISKLILTYEEVAEGIITGKANLTRSFAVTTGAPTKFQASRLCSTLRRMVKYGERGYKFSSYPEIVEVDSQLLQT